MTDGIAYHVGNFLTDWNEAKVFVEHSTDLSHDVLHVLVGAILWLAATALSRRTIASPLPLLIIVGLAIVNEIADLRAEIWPNRAQQIGEMAQDIAMTISVPLMLFLAARFMPKIFVVRRK